MSSPSPQRTAIGTTVNTMSTYTIVGPIVRGERNASPNLTATSQYARHLHRVATGGMNVQYQFWLYNANATPAWSCRQGYSTTPTFAWTPTTPGNYVFSVTAVDETGAAANTLLNYTIN